MSPLYPQMKSQNDASTQAIETYQMHDRTQLKLRINFSFPKIWFGSQKCEKTEYKIVIEFQQN